MIPFLIVISIFVAATYLIGSLPVRPPSIPETKHAEGEYPDRKDVSALNILRRGLGREAQFLSDEHDEVIAVGTIFIALYTIVLGVATQSMVRESREASKRQLRAYVGIDKIELVIPNVRNKSHVIPDPLPTGYAYADYALFNLKNFGQTPAIKTKVVVNWQPTIFGFRLKENEFAFGDLGDEGESAYVVDPGATQYALISFVKTEYLANIRDAMDKKLSLHFYGRVDYTDIFGDRWSREFCLMYEPWLIDGRRFNPYGPRNRETKQDK